MGVGRSNCSRGARTPGDPPLSLPAEGSACGTPAQGSKQAEPRRQPDCRRPERDDTARRDSAEAFAVLTAAVSAMSCALLAATVDEGRRGARHSAGAGRVDVIGHPVGPDTYAGLHSVLAEARERGIPGRIPRHEHRVSTASRRSSASTCGTSPTSPPPPESMRVGGNKNRWKQEGCLHPPGSPRRPPPR
jgi:hypothetical protein